VNAPENYRKLQKITENYRKLQKITDIEKVTVTERTSRRGSIQLFIDS
jgi:hypothetical protein